MNILFTLVLIINGHAYVIDHDLTASDCLEEVTKRHDAGLPMSYMRCEAQPK